MIVDKLHENYSENMKTFLIPFVTAMIVMGVIDSIWLGYMVPRFYKPGIGHLLANQMKLGAAVVFYLVFIAGLTVFVTYPALQNEKSYLAVLLLGMFYGLATYGTYDLTNYVTLKDWPLKIVIVDMIWGTALTGTVSILTVWISRFFLTR